MNKKKNLTVEETFALAVQNQQKNNLQVAENLYKETLKINPNHVDAHNNLGIVFKELGEHQKAIDCYEKAIQTNPNHAAAHNNLGVVFDELGEYKKAKNCYQKVTQIQPNNAVTYNNLGAAFKQLGELQKAVSSCQKAIQINPNYASAHNNLGAVFYETGELQKAKNCYQKVTQIQPNDATAYNNLGAVFRQLGEPQKAISCYENAIQIEPDNLTSHWLSMNTFPVIYENLKEIDLYRIRFEDSIKKVNRLLDTQPQYTKQQIIDAMKSSTNFGLAYQGRNYINLQQKYANLIERLTKKIYPQFQQEIKINKPIKFIKIGFVSPFFTNHSITKTYKNWILKLNQNLFKTFVYYVGNKFDEITDLIRDHADNFFSHTNVDQLIDQISKDKLDILIYLDIGMHPKMQILASLRLAPIQCNTFGHPVTSGLKNIDYFFSSELMETKDSQKYYSEKLINLPGIGTDYNHPDLSNIKKTNNLKQSNKIIFLNFQNLFKLLPQDDHVFLDIQQKEPNCQFWFFEARSELMTSIFKSRVSKLSKDYGISFNKYFHFHPKGCKYNEFLGIIEASDIILDSLNFSGFNTAMEAISLNKPIVTLPELFMRTRLTYSILKKIDIEETIASTKEKYVEIAVKLAKDSDFRNSIIKKIVKNKSKLFNDDKPIRFLEEVIKKKLLQLT